MKSIKLNPVYAGLLPFIGKVLSDPKQQHLRTELLSQLHDIGKYCDQLAEYFENNEKRKKVKRRVKQN